MITPELLTAVGASDIYVPPTGPLDARIVIIGEAPGKQEEKVDEPFVGGSGLVLNQMLQNCGINRHECYVTNVVKYRPSNNDFRTFYADRKLNHPTPLLLQSIDDLHRELSRLRPNVIIACGGEALRAVTGKRGIGNWRGSILSSPFGKVVPTFHPAYILRVWGEKPIAEHDIRRAAAESTTKELNLPTHTFITRPTFQQVSQYIQKCREATRFSFDIETSGEHVRCLGLACSQDTAICIPFLCNPQESPLGFLSSEIHIASSSDSTSGPEIASYWTEVEEREILLALDDLFRSPNEKVGQNLAFDVTILSNEFGFVFRNLYMDTMVAHHTCFSEFPKDLGFLCSMYTRVPCYWVYDVSNDQQTWVYNCYDCAVTLEISEVLEREMKNLKVDEFYFSHVHPTTLALIRIQSRGILVDKVLRSEMETRCRTQLVECLSKLHAYTNDTGFNPDSAKQLSILLYDKLKLPVQVHPTTRQRTASKDAIKALKRSPKHAQYNEFFDLLLLHSKLSTFLSTFLAKPTDDNGRIYTSYNSAGTVTRRLSSSEPLFLPGTNLQNLPRGNKPNDPDFGFRRVFLADPDHWLIKFDLSQAEQRIVMWMARVLRVIERWSTDPSFNIHKFIGSLIYRCPESEIVKGSDRYNISKNGGYGGNYGMAPPKASIVYDMDLATSRFVLSQYHTHIPEIQRNFWRDVQLSLAKTRTIVSPTGGRRIFFGRLDDSTFRDAYSHSAQSVVGDIINRALHLFEEIADPTECRIHLQVHDELVFMCRKEPSIVKRYVSIIKNLMEYSLHFPPIERPLVIPVEGSYGPNWFDQKDIQELL